VLDLDRRDTICALATAPGRGALAVVRVSGSAALAVRDVVFRRRRPGGPKPGVAVLGDVVDDDGAVIDEALCTTFVAPRSFTGEDTVEWALHGSPLVVEMVLRRLVAAGARPATPGEFTLRAVLTGRIDLAAAEAVDAVIQSRSTAALRASQRALRGGLRASLDRPRGALVDVLAELEARLDFPDEPLGDADRDRLRRGVAGAEADLAHLLRAAPRGRRLVEGARVVLYGAPNAGKSTLLNALVGSARAIVHDEPGTTRDVLEAAVDVDGVVCVLVDVAGVRDDDDGRPLHPVERAGVERARAEVHRADVVLAVAPPGQPFLALPRVTDAGASAVADPVVVRVRSKVDLAADAGDAGDAGDADVRVAAVHGEGLDALRACVARALGTAGVDDDEAVVQTARQEQALRHAHAAVVAAGEALGVGWPDEIVCSELRRAGRALDGVTGGDVGVDVLDLVFRRFCIGK
jgi:tRNA modification GTPase